MADKDKDKPENRGLAPLWRQSVQGVGDFGGEIVTTLRKDRLDSALAVVAPIFGVPMVGLAVMLSGGDVQRHFEADTAATAGQINAAHGYVAISENDGASGLALFRGEDAYRLYRFERKPNGEATLQFVGDREDAWHDIRQMVAKMAQSVEAAQNPQGNTAPSHVEFFRFSELSGPMTQDNGVVRIGKGIEEIVPQGSIAAAIVPQLEAWRAASVAVEAGQYGFGGQAPAQASYTETQVKDYTMAKIIGSIFGTLTGIGLLGVGVSAAGNARRRRKTGGYSGRSFDRY